MNSETNLGSNLIEISNQLRTLGKAAEKEKERIRSKTVSTREYCRLAGISRPTLDKRRELGLIPFTMIGAEYRYFSPEKGGSNG